MSTRAGLCILLIYMDLGLFMRPGNSLQGLGSVKGHLEERAVFPLREREASKHCDVPSGINGSPRSGKCLM